MHRHNLQSWLTSMKRQFELGMEFVMVLASMYWLWKLLHVTLVRSRASHRQRATLLRVPSSSWKDGREKQVRKDLEYLSLQGVF